jgi:hypothetical protein
MDFLDKPPRWLTDRLPETARDLLEGGGWWVVLGFVALVVLLLTTALLGRLARAVFGRRRAPVPRDDLEEKLAEYPPPATLPSRRQLTYEGISVRLRLVVVAAVGKDHAIDPASAYRLLDQVLPGLGSIAAHDQAQVRVWPNQVSSEGFRVTFHRSTPVPEGEGQPSHWIPLAGRAKVAGQHVLIGLALWTADKTTLSRRTLEPHQWALALRIKPREA